jgi:alpha-tubulin suppressor-like RCC1 family protein
MNAFSSSPHGGPAGPAGSLASYYARHQWLKEGVAHTWRGAAAPRRAIEGVQQVGVSQDAFFALRTDGELVRWADDPPGAAAPMRLMRGVARFAAGQSGWFAIDREGALWYSADDARAAASATLAPTIAGVTPRRVAADVVAACIGDSADYYIARGGTLFVKGLAHRGQYGDGLLKATADFVATATEAVAVVAHTGHALHLKRDGSVHGTGGNRFGPLSTHGLGDKADRWGLIFEGAVAIATGSRHSAALRADGSLWVWGEGFATAPRKLYDDVAEVAAGDTATLALTRRGELWQWERGEGPRRVRVG